MGTFMRLWGRPLVFQFIEESLHVIFATARKALIDASWVMHQTIAAPGGWLNLKRAGLWSSWITPTQLETIARLSQASYISSHSISLLESNPMPSALCAMLAHQCHYVLVFTIYRYLKAHRKTFLSRKYEMTPVR